jgi:hypothetical protein
MLPMDIENNYKYIDISNLLCILLIVKHFRKTVS